MDGCRYSPVARSIRIEAGARDLTNDANSHTFCKELEELSMCTNFLLDFPSPAQGAKLRVSARTVELSGYMHFSLYVVPRDQHFPVHPPRHLANPLTWKTRFGFVGISPPGTTVFMDGLNEKGLSAAALWLPGTVYPTDASLPQIAFSDFCSWLLGNFEHVDEIEHHLKKIAVWGPAPVNQGQPDLQVPIR